jgi:hypothetical protein
MHSKDDDDEVRKSSTMNSMYIGSTISKPNVDSIINAVATILHSQMLEVSFILFFIYFKFLLSVNPFLLKTKFNKKKPKLFFLICIIQKD